MYADVVSINLTYPTYRQHQLNKYNLLIRYKSLRNNYAHYGNLLQLIILNIRVE